MRTFSNDEKKFIAETVQDSFLHVFGKRWHTCRYESLTMLDVLRWLDPQGEYVDRWALTWIVTNRWGPGAKSEDVMWDFEDRYHLGVRNEWRIRFRNVCPHRMAHNYIIANPGSESQIIDISSNYHGDLLRREMELPIRWEWDWPFVWEPYQGLPEELRYWYKPAISVTDTECQEPPPGLIPKIVHEGKSRLTSLGIGPL